MHYTRLFLFLLIAFGFQKVKATVHHVGRGLSYTSIQKAIEVSHHGDTIIVHPGIYREHGLIINKSLTIKGIDYPELDGERKFEVVAIKANDVTFDGFKVVHSGKSSLNDLAGIKIYNGRNVIIINNVLEDNFFGIYALFSTNSVIKNNVVVSKGRREQESGNGIHCLRCDSMQIIHNTIRGHRDGIYFEFVTNSTIWRNTSEENIRYGLHFMISNNNTYVVNIFKNNGSGVAVMYTHDVKMFGNFFIQNKGEASYSLLLKEISDSYIVGNRFTDNTSGIFMDGCARNLVERNLFKNNGYAMQLQANCEDVRINGNNFINNTFDISTNGSLVLSKFQQNYWDKYEGYDLNKDNIGDVPYRPVSLYSMLVEKNSTMMMLFRSFMVSILDKTEKILPSVIPESLKDEEPLMKPLPL